MQPSWGWLTPADSFGVGWKRQRAGISNRVPEPFLMAGADSADRVQEQAPTVGAWWHGLAPQIQPHGPHGFLMFLEAVTAAAGALAVQTLVVYVVSVGGFEEKICLLRVGWCESLSSGVHSWWVQRDLVKQQQCETFSSTVQTAQGCASTRVYWSWIWLSWGP